MNKFVTICFLMIGVFGFSQATDTTKKRVKIDGVSAVVGDYVILESDVDKAYVELESQGVSTKEVSRCNLLGKLMEDKLYACLLYTSPSPRDGLLSRMPSSA